jgi:hypothetical protein
METTKLSLMSPKISKPVVQIHITQRKLKVQRNTPPIRFCSSVSNSLLTPIELLEQFGSEVEIQDRITSKTRKRFKGRSATAMHISPKPNDIFEHVSEET